MIYTKAEIVALIRERAYRDANQDNAKVKPYTAAYLAAAVNYALTKQYYTDYRDGGEKDLPGLFNAVYVDIDVEWDPIRKLHYFLYPSRLVAMGRDRGVPFIGPTADETKNYPIVAQSQASAAGRYMPYSNRSFAQLENDRVILKNHNAIVDKVTMKVIGNVMDLDDDDPVPIPAGLEVEVIQICADFLLGRRQLPQDTINDGKE